MIKLELVTLILLMGCFGLKKKHPLIILLTLELFLLMIIKANLKLGNELYFALMLISIGACEAAVGLSTLMGSVRVMGAGKANV